jgi:hypothetical protein
MLRALFVFPQRVQLEPDFALRRFQFGESDGGSAMGLLTYLALFVAACGFGWWAKNADKHS